MSKLMIFSDAHIHKHRRGASVANGVQSRLKAGLDVLSELVTQSQSYDRVLFAGDLFHIAPTPAAIYNHVLEILKPIAPKLIMIAGNHDFGGLEFTSGYDVPFRTLIEWGAVLLDGPNTVALDGLTYGGQHFRRGGIDYDMLPEKCDVLMVHGMVEGAVLETGRKLQGKQSLDADKLLGRSKLVVAGDIHKPQVLYEGRFLIPGSLMPIRSSDAGDRGFYECSTDDLTPTFVPIESSAITLQICSGEDKKGSELLPVNAMVEWPDDKTALASYVDDMGLAADLGLEMVSQAQAKADTNVYSTNILESVEGSNFGCFGDFKYTIDKGVTLVLGEVDGDEDKSNGSGKCLAGETILTHAITGERLSVKELYESKRTDFSVSGLDKDLQLRPSGVTAVQQSGKKKLVRITLANGMSEVVSLTHPILTNDLSTTKAGDLSIGDVVAQPHRMVLESPINYLSVSEARVLAGYMAEGSLTGGYSIGFTNTDEDIIKQINLDLMESFYLKLVRVGKTIAYHVKREDSDVTHIRAKILSHLDAINMPVEAISGIDAPRCRRLETSVSNTTMEMLIDVSGDAELLRLSRLYHPQHYFRNFFKNWGIFGKKSIDKELDSRLFQCDDTVVGAFLGFFISCDGHVSDSDKRSPEVSIGLASKALVFGLQQLLQQRGIIGRVRYKKIGDKDSWLLSISTEASNILQLQTLIGGHVYGPKAVRLQRMYDLAPGKLGNPNIDTVPPQVFLPYINEIDHFSSKCDGLTCDRAQLQNHGMGRLMCLKYGTVFDSQRLRDLGLSDIFWTKVVSIDVLGEDATYDIQIDNETSLYALNGFITHNSTLFESLSWCLWGKTSKGVGAKEVVRKGAQTCWVEVILRDAAGEALRIRRTRTASKQNLEVVGADDVYQGTATAVQGQLDKLLGVDFEVFQECSYFSQEQFVLFSRMSNSDRKGLLARFLGLGVYDGALAIAKDQYKDVGAKASVVKSELLSLESRRETINLYLSGAQARKAAIEAELAGIDKPTVNVDGLMGELDKALAQKELLVEQRDSVQGVAVKTSSALDEVHAKKSGISSKFVETRTKIEGIRAQIERVRGLSGRGKCPTCFSDIEDSHIDHIVAGIEQEEMPLLEEYLTLKNMIAAVDTEGLRAADELQACRTKISDIGSQINGVEDVVRSIEGKLTVAKNVVGEYDKKVNGCRVRIDEVDKTVVESQKGLADISALVKEKQLSISGLEANMAILDKWVTVFGPQGFRNTLMESAVRLLTTSVNGILSRTAAGFTVNIGIVEKPSTTELAVTLFRGGSIIEYKSLSGGEKQKVDIAVLLALVGLLSQKWGLQQGLFGILILDEVVSFLDSHSIEVIAEEIKQAPVSSVFLVTHITELKGLFEKVLLVKQSDGVSTIE